LSSSKLRPAVVFADVGHGDWLLCQITSNPYRDAGAIRLTNAELAQGGLDRVSFARPLKLFTAHESLMVKRVAVLNDKTFTAILTATIELLQKNLPLA
jgi:mRNA interferase MazF